MSATVTNLQEFSLSLKKFQAKSEKQAVQVQGKVTLEILRGVIRGTPVDTGVLRGNWTVGIGTSDGAARTGFTDNAKTGFGIVGAANIATAAIALSSLKLGTPTYVVNHTVYGPHVNRNHPNKAGWVEAAVANVQSKIDGVSA